MSPSRGFVASTLCVTLRSSPVALSSRRLVTQCTTAVHPSGSQANPRLSMRCAPYRSVSFDVNPKPVPQQQAYGHTGVQDYEFDSSLFEEEDEQYIAGRTRAPSSEAHQDGFLSNSDSVQTMLRSLLQAERYADATNALHEMHALSTSVEPHASFADAALHCAEQGDLRSSVAWLRVIPSRQHVGQHGESNHVAMTRLSNTLAKVLQSFVAASDAERVWNMLLWLARQNYLAVADTFDVELPYRMAEALSWLTQFQYIVKTPSNEPFAEWSVRFWHAFTSLAMRSDIEFHMNMAQTSYEDAKNVRMMLWLAKGPDTMSASLVRMYNLCIRSFCRARRYDVAFAWLRVSDVFDLSFHSHEAKSVAYSSSDLSSRTQDWLPVNTANILSYHTWQVVVSRVYHGGPTAVKEVQAELDLLINQLQEQIRPNTPRNGRLDIKTRSKRMLSIVKDVLAESRDAYVESRKSVSRKFGDLEETIDDFITDAQPMLGLLHYFQHVRDPQLLALARNVLPVQEFTEAKAANDLSPRAQVHAFPSLSVFGLRCLLDILRRDHKRLLELYTLWLASVAHFQTVRTPDSNASPSLSEFGQLADGVFEVLGDASHAAIRPTERHFAAFMRRLPRALTRAGRRWVTRLQPSQSQTEQRGFEAPEHATDEQDKRLRSSGREQETGWTSFEENAHLEACRWAAQILTDMQRFNMQPDLNMFNWLLDTVTRNIDMAPTDHAKFLPSDFPADSEAITQDVCAPELDAVWRITNALRMGPSSSLEDEHEMEEQLPPPMTSSSSVSVSASMARPTLRTRAPIADPSTYAFLIRAFTSVPRARGGPLLFEARMVQRWLRADRRAQEQLREFPETFATLIQRTDELVDDVEGAARRSRAKYMASHGLRPESAHTMHNLLRHDRAHADDVGFEDNGDVSSGAEEDGDVIDDDSDGHYHDSDGHYHDSDEDDKETSWRGM